MGDSIYERIQFKERSNDIRKEDKIMEEQKDDREGDKRGDNIVAFGC